MDNHLLQTLIDYRWAILVPLSFGESWVVAFVAAMLATTGYFNIWALAGYFFVRDIVLDLGYYAVGHYSGRSKFVMRMLAKIHVTEASLNTVREAWERRPARTMFIGKLSYGLAQAFIIAAGTVGMSLRKFVGWGAVAAIVQYGTLLFLGYFFGASYGGNILKMVQNIQYIFLGGSVVLIGYYGFALYMRRRMVADDEAITKQDHE